MPRNITNTESSTSNLRHMAQHRGPRSRRYQCSFPGYLTAEQASYLGLAIRRGAPKTPIQVARFLGYNVPRSKHTSYKSSAEFCAKVEAAVVAWLPALGLELHVEHGKNSTSSSAGQERYVDFRVPKTKAEPFTVRPGFECKVWRDPSLATWTPQEGAQRVAERKQQRAAAWGGAA